MYHRVADHAEYDQLVVSPDRFAAHMAYLAREHRIVSLGEALTLLEDERSIFPCVAVTFDDGYLDNLTNALPILERYAIPATIFITTSFCDQTARLPRHKQEKGRLHLTWEEVKALHAESNITIGSHTLSHPNLPRMSASDSYHEIGASKEYIENRLGAEIAFFSYPRGDFSQREINYAQRSGYRGAVTVSPGANRKTTPHFSLRRTEITDRDSVSDLAAKLSGAYDPAHLILDWKRRFVFARAARSIQHA